MNEVTTAKTFFISNLPQDAAEHLETKIEVAAYLETAFEDGDPVMLIAI